MRFVKKLLKVFSIYLLYMFLVTQISHKYVERRLLVAEACGALASYLSVSTTISVFNLLSTAGDISRATSCMLTHLH